MSEAMRNPSEEILPSPQLLRGRQVFMESLLAHGVEFIFGNPGTTEMPIMGSLADYPDLSYVLTLHESVALGAAHYYAQATGKTGIVNVHVGPGLGNSLGMLYDAWEANSPLIVTAGQQDTRMRLREPLLGHDLVAMAAPLTKWSVQAESADELGHVLHRAFKIAHEPPAGPVFVSLPINVLEQETANPILQPAGLFSRSEPDPEGLSLAVDVLLAAHTPAIIVGDGVARADALSQLVELSELLGATVRNEGLVHQVNFPGAHPNFRDRMAFDHAGIRQVLNGVDVVLLIGGSFFEEVWFDEVSPFPPAAKILQIDAAPRRLALNFSPDVALLADPGAAITALGRAIVERGDASYETGARERNEALAIERAGELEGQAQRAAAGWDSTPISTARLMADLRDSLPANAVLVNEAITGSGDLVRSVLSEKTGDYYGTRGGGIGQALPGALGVKLAHPERPVVAISGDGSAMYSIQALWTAVHHNLAVVYVILHNRTYRILKFNMDIYRRRFGVENDGSYPHMDLTTPELDFVELARGMGMKAQRIEAADDFKVAFEEALDSDGPVLLDVLVDGSVS